MFDMFWGKSMDDIRQLSPDEMIRFADRFRDLMYNMPFQLPQNLLMLGRTVAILSGMCVGLDQDFNLWNQLAPYAAKLVSQEVGSNWQVWLDELGNVLKELITIPTKLGRVLSQVERGDITVQVPGIGRQMLGLEKAINRLTGSIIFTALLIGGMMLYIDGKDTFAYITLAGSGIALIWTIFFSRSGSRRYHP
jgi:Predicted unusual protein kinase